MFLTTIRVRRARRETLDRVLSAKQLQDVHKDGAVVEVTCHSHVVAVVRVGEAFTEVVWSDNDLNIGKRAGGVPATAFRNLVRDAVTIMVGAKERGLCERDDRPLTGARS